MAEYRKPLPLPDLDSQAFWDSCRNHAMALQQCTACKHFRYPPRPLCPHCHNPEAEWKPVSGRDGFTLHWSCAAVLDRLRNEMCL